MHRRPHVLLRTIAVTALAAAPLACRTPTRDAAPPRPTSFALVHASVVDVAAGEVRADQTVVVQGGQIVAVGSAAGVAVPAGAHVVDATGRYVIPGLWDMHVHLAMSGRASLGAFVANGVTSVRDMGGDLPRVRAWRDSASYGWFDAPRAWLAGPIVESAPWLRGVVDLLRREATPAEVQHLAERIPVATAADAEAAVDSIARMRADFVKLRTDPPSEALFALLRAARVRKLRVAMHGPTRTSIVQASDSGAASFEHGFMYALDAGGAATFDQVRPSARARIFATLARNRTAFTATLVATRGYRLTPDSVLAAVMADSLGAREPRRRYVPRDLVTHWRTQLALRKYESPLDWPAIHRASLRDLAEMRAAGVPLLVGTDAGAPLVFPGFSLHDELALLVREGGLSPAEALRAATLGAARFMGVERVAGTVEPTKQADLVLLDANPLTDITATTRIRAVVSGGRYLDRAALDALLASVAAAAAR